MTKTQPFKEAGLTASDSSIVELKTDTKRGALQYPIKSEQIVS